MDILHVQDEATLDKFGYLPSSLTFGSAKRVIFKCEFCHRNFESSFKSTRRSKHTTCSRCRSIAAAYTTTGVSQDKHEFWKNRQIRVRPGIIDKEETIRIYGYNPFNLGAGSKQKIIANCEFCLCKFTTTPAVLNNKPELSACKRCDAIASVYVRFNETGDKHQFYLSKRPKVNADCLDIEATKNQFGYSPLDLSTYSAKKVVVICKYCGTRLTIRMSKFSIREGLITCWSCMRQKTIETLEKRYGVKCTLDIPAVRKKLADPKTEQIIAAFLRDRYKVDFIRNHTIGPYSFDFYIPSINLLVECQGDFFHNFKEFGYSGMPKDRAKSSYIENNTVHKLVWVWEHEIHIGRLRKIFDYHIYNAIEPKRSVTLNDIEIRKLSNNEAHSFLSQYHYLGNLGMVATSFGAFFEDLLIVVCVFGGTTRNQSIKKVNKFLKTSYGPKQIRELRRFCVRPNIEAKNLASFSLKRFIQAAKDGNRNTKAIISFSDPTVGDQGTIYKASNWRKMLDTVPSYHYVDSKTSQIIHKRTVWGMAKAAHMTEKDFVASSGLRRVEELPKSMWIKVF
jgi:very-short-patch-repair endonuclease